MLKKVVFIGILLLSLIVSGFSTCVFNDNSQNNCSRYYSGIGDISLQVPVDLPLESSSLEIYQENSLSQFPFLTQKQNPNYYELENALAHSGVYSINSWGKDSLGSKLFDIEKNIIIDVYQPSPPLVPLVIESNTIHGFGDHIGDIIVAYNANGEMLAQSQVLEDTSFTITLPITTPSYVYFIAKSPNNLESEKVERYMYLKEIPQYIYTNVNTLSFNENIISTVNKVKSGKTHKRNFFITGTTSSTLDGSLIYINGQKTQVVDNSFGTFVELNTGKNIIEAKSKFGVILASYAVEYDDTKFTLNKLNIQKIFENSFSISGETSIQKPLLVFVDGSYVTSIIPQDDNSFSFTGNTQRNKVLVELYGENNVYESQLLYKDTQNPQVLSYNFKQVNTPKSLLFKVTDDVGVDHSSLFLEFNSGEKLNYSRLFGDFVVFDISKLNVGEYTYTLRGEDKVSKQLEGELSGTLSIINSLDFSIEKKDQLVFGSMIFSKDEEISLKLNASGPIAFKHIYVNGIEHIDYLIGANNIISIENLNLNGDEGDITFEYIDNKGISTSKTYGYIVDSKKSNILVDSIIHHSTSDDSQLDSYVRISGKIEDSLFDWGSFFINGNIPYFVSNSYFEGMVKVENKNLEFSGNDIVNNGIELVGLSDVFEIDSTSANIVIEDNKNSLIGNIQETFNSGFEEIVSIQNTQSRRSHFETQFDLPLEQREGIQLSTLSGRNQLSQKSYGSLFTHQVDSTNPQIYSIEEDGFYFVHVDSTYSSIQKKVFTDSEGEIISSTSCKSMFTNGKCYKIVSGDYYVNISDSFENSYFSKLTPISSQEKIVSFDDIYFHGNDIFIDSKKAIIQGSFVSQNLVEDILVDGKKGTCEFDTQNFICEVDAGIGDNNFNIAIQVKEEIIIDDGEIIIVDVNETIIVEEKNITIVRGGENPLTFDAKITSGIFKFGLINYYFGDIVSSELTLNQDAQISYYVNGVEVKSGNFLNGSNTLDIDLNPYLDRNRNLTKLELGFKAKNQNDQKESSLFTLIYEKSKDLILEILIN